MVLPVRQPERTVQVSIYLGDMKAKFTEMMCTGVGAEDNLTTSSITLIEYKLLQYFNTE
jgi:hypothetical protein